MMQSLTRPQPGAAADAPAALPHKRAHTILLVYAGLAVVVLLAVGGSAYWVYHNVVLVGRDAAGHLEQSILVAKTLASSSWQGLFEATVLDEYRPPGLYLLTQPAYWLFGRNQQTALIPNIAMLGAVVTLTFVLARKVLNDWLALFAALLVSLLPMAAAMARLYYMETLLTTALLLALLALLRSDGFASRRWALALGAGLGVMLLVKWTTPIYLLVPVLYVLWRHDFWRAQRRALQAPAIDWRRALLSLAAAAALALLVVPAQSHLRPRPAHAARRLAALAVDPGFCRRILCLGSAPQQPRRQLLERAAARPRRGQHLVPAPYRLPRAPVGCRLWHRSRPAGGLGPAAARHVHSLFGFLDYRPHGSACRRADSPGCLRRAGCCWSKKRAPTGAPFGVLRPNHWSSTGSCLPVPGSF